MADETIITRSSERYFVRPDQAPRWGFEWGEIRITVSRDVNGAERCSGGIVVMPPGKGHGRHNHPGVEEVIFVISGTGTQMVEDDRGQPIVAEVSAGTTVLVPADRFHYTINTGIEPMRVFVIYVPGGAEQAMRQLPDFRQIASGTLS